MVPHLTTALTGPINELEQRILESAPAIERWFRLEWMEHTPPIYSSVDVRNSGFKLAPVDTNLFPSHWDQITPDMLPLAVQAAMAAIEKICPEARNLLIIPENNPKTASYYSNLAQLQRIFHMAGLHVRLGSINPDLKESTIVTTPSGEQLLLEPATMLDNQRFGLVDFDPCSILLNTDLSAGAPGILEDLKSQYLLPPLHAGWTVRRKSKHFECYEEVAKRFGKMLGIDHWLINPLFTAIQNPDLSTPNAKESLAHEVDSLLTKIRRKYKEYGISEKPFVLIKADNGTRGIGVTTLRDALDLKTLTLEHPVGQPNSVSPLMLQEGVLTIEQIKKQTAEPVVYMFDRYVVGGFYRTHAECKADENLNRPDAQYVHLSLGTRTHLPPQPKQLNQAEAPNRFYMYGVIARLAMLAASYELEATDPDAVVYS